MSAHRVATVILTLAVATSPIAAQELSPGSKVRIRVVESPTIVPGAAWKEVTVLWSAGDTLWYRSSDGTHQRHLLLSRSSVLAGKDRRKRGMLIGGLIGAAVGGLIAHSSFEAQFVDRPLTLSEALGCALSGGCRDRPQTQLRTRGEETLGGIAAGAGAGILLGMFVGRSVWTWEPLDRTEIRGSATGLSMSLRH